MKFNSLKVFGVGILCAICMLGSGCVTASPERSTQDVNVDRANELQLLDDVDHAPWESWTPVEPRMPSELDDWIVFDRYRLDESAELETVWSSIFGVLSGVRNQLDNEDAHASTRVLMALLEPTEDTVFELLFVASTTGEREGVLLRGHHRSEPTRLSVLLARDQGGFGPAKVQGWFVPGFEEAPVLKISLERVDRQWVYETIVGREQPSRVTHPDDAASLVASVVQEGLWSPWVGSSYSSLEGRDKPESIEGMQARQRSINEVLSDTVFAPRVGRIPPGAAQ